MHKSTIRFVMLLSAVGCIWLGLSLPSAAVDDTPTKVTAQNRTGDLPFSTSIGTDIEHVDAVSGNLIVRIPITSVPGRGMDFRFLLRWDGLFWSAGTHSSGGSTWQSWNIEKRNYIPAANTGLGWEPSTPRTTFTPIKASCVGGGFATQETNYIHHDVNGGKHPMTVQSGSDCLGTPIEDYEGPDATGEGMWANILGGDFIYLADGTQFNGAFTDTNGNQKTETAGGKDTLGRIIVTQSSGSNQILYKVYDSNGVQHTYTVNYSNLSLSTAFNISGPYGPILEYSGTRSAVTSIVLPNGRQYSFQYESGSYGGITRLDLPTGAYITYTWGTLACDDKKTHRYVTSRTVHVGSQANTWSLQRTGCEPITSTVTDPLGNQSVYVSNDGNTTSASLYQGAAGGTPLRQYTVDYISFTNPRDPFHPTKLPIRVTTALENGLVSKKEFDYDSFTYTYTQCPDPTQCGVPVQGTTSRGNVVESREYDYGSGAPGALVRKTTNTYLHDSNANYLTYHIVSKILSQTIYDGGGGQKAQTQFEYDSTAITGTSGAPQHDYTNYSSTFIYRGNASKVKKWRNTDGALLTSSYIYDDLGNIRSVTDPGSHTTSFSYTDSFSGSGCAPPANSLAYVSQVTNHLGQRTQLVRYRCTGLVQARKDENDILASRAGTTFTYDLLGRTLTKSASDGGLTSNTYNDTPPVSVTTTTSITGGLSLISVSIRDGLGRATQSQLTSDPEGTVSVETTYDALGRTATASNPYRSGTDPTYGITSTIYDALGRVTLVIPPDGSQSANNVSSVYAGNCATVTDQAGKKRKSCSDALGRLTQVFEPDAGGSFIYETDYQYDTLDNLTRVDQKGNDSNSANWRTRTFTYNSLSQLLTASNPESGTINYTYDADGNLLTKQDARLITTTYAYDALHRLTGKTYSNGDPAVSYFYDQTSYNGLTIANGKGRRTGMSDASGQTAWSFDSMGRASTERRTISGVTKTIGYQYNLDASLAALTYPSGRVVNYSYSGAARPLSVIDDDGTKYVSGATYGPQGALTGAVYGAVTGGFTGITVSNSYNKRLQPVLISAASPSQTLLSLSYGFNLGTGDNGNVFQIQNNIDAARTQTFTYDELNRIKTAEVPTAWGLSFGYDIWGNLLSQTVTKGSAPMLSLGVDGNNRVTNTGFSYDYSGDVLTDGANTYSYDAESRISTTAGVTYTYDGDGKRVKKSSGKLYWTGTGTDALTESDLTGAASDEYVFVGSARTARKKSSGEVNYYLADHLRSSHVVTTATGSVLDDADFFPFGGERPLLSASGNSYKFTGKERDAESGLDFFGARYYGGSFGRLTSPDPAGATPVSLTNPQLLNLYAYALNNPLRFIDPTGMYVIDPYTRCHAGDTKCQTRAKERAADIKKKVEAWLGKIDQAIAKLQRSGKDPAALSRLQAARQAIGNFGDKGVTIGTREQAHDQGYLAEESGAPMSTLPPRDTKRQDYYVAVNFDSEDNDSIAATDLAHEGTHVDDFKAGMGVGDHWRRRMEKRGYETSAWGASQLDLSPFSKRGVVIWQDGWSNAQVDAAVDKLLDAANIK